MLCGSTTACAQMTTEEKKSEYQTVTPSLLLPLLPMAVLVRRLLRCGLQRNVTPARYRGQCLTPWLPWPLFPRCRNGIRGVNGASSYASGITAGASFNRTLTYDRGYYMGLEAKANNSEYFNSSIRLRAKWNSQQSAWTGRRSIGSPSSFHKDYHCTLPYYCQITLGGLVGRSCDAAASTLFRRD